MLAIIPLGPAKILVAMAVTCIIKSGSTSKSPLPPATETSDMTTTLKDVNHLCIKACIITVSTPNPLPDSIQNHLSSSQPRGSRLL